MNRLIYSFIEWFYSFISIVYKYKSLYRLNESLYCLIAVLGGFFGAQSERREKGAILALKGRYGKRAKIGCITNDTPHPQGSFLG